MHEVLVNCLVKLAQERSVVRWTDCPDMIIAVVCDVKNQTKTKSLNCFTKINGYSDTLKKITFKKDNLTVYAS